MDTELDTQTEEAENRQTGRQQRMHMVLFMLLGLKWLSMNQYCSFIILHTHTSKIWKLTDLAFLSLSSTLLSAAFYSYILLNLLCYH